MRPPEGGLRQESWIIGEQIRTLSKERFVERWGLVSRETLSASLEVVAALLGFRCLEIEP